MTETDAARIAKISKAVRFLPEQRTWAEELVFVLNYYASQSVAAEAPMTETDAEFWPKRYEELRLHVDKLQAELALSRQALASGEVTEGAILEACQAYEKKVGGTYTADFGGMRAALTAARLTPAPGKDEQVMR